MKTAIIGGRLQGVEAAYLSKKAGWTVVLVDKESHVPARDLADEFYQSDVLLDPQLPEILAGCQLIIPALENQAALDQLILIADQIRVPLVFDPAAYRVSASKIASNQLFIRSNIPIPALWPDCAFPLVVKPSGSSGSDGVKRVADLGELEGMGFDPEKSPDWVVQEFLAGPSYSIEVIGFAGHYRTYQVTQLEMDHHYDCKRVLAPADLGPDLADTLRDIAERAAAALDLNGIMDVEVILDRDQLKVLEIDARLPSQTPTAVYHSTGDNLVEILGRCFSQGEWPAKMATSQERGVVYEHIRVSPENAEICGEHLISLAGPLQLLPGFWGADEALTDYQPDRDTWVATLINTGPTRQDAWAKRNRVLEAIARSIGQNTWLDPWPEDEVTV